MSTVIVQPSFSGNLKINNKTPQTPGWDNSSGTNILNTMNDYSKWWNDGTTPPNDPDAFYSVVSNNPDGIIRTYTQYGQDTSIWASSKAIKMTYQISNEVINDDNSITFNLTINVYGASHITQNPGAGVSVTNTVKLGSSVLLNRSGNTKDSYVIQPSGNPYVFNNITIQPRSSFSLGQLSYSSVFPNHEYADQTINLASNLFNPLYAYYIPLKVKSGGNWNVVNNSSTGHIKIKRNGAWETVDGSRYDTQNQPNTGKTRYKSGGNWLQSPLPK